MQMEVCSHLSFPVNDSNTLHGFHMNTLVGNFPMDELSYKTTKFLNIQDDIKGVSDNLPKPVSAMKGSREKRGLRPAKQLTVKWAPDVYDPVVPCSTVVIVVKRPRKKNGGQPKSSQGGKSKSKGKGKEKKQSRKRGGEVL